MIRAVDIKAELAGRPVLGGRGKDTTEAEAEAAFATLAPFRDGGIFAGSFSGDSPWERHRQGDELVPRILGRRHHAHHHDGRRASVLRDDGGDADRRAAGPLAPIPRPGWGHGAHRNSAAHRPHGRGRPEDRRVATPARTRSFSSATASTPENPPPATTNVSRLRRISGSGSMSTSSSTWMA